ncbi:SEC-C metal-binding domain-containing protein [Sphingomonas sp. MMS12-HWE2-04]|uniref:SEC-C metal-binding domain-containing protein n=1 Tax=Sphingomonas sp. MMS12-HWE2-04 TaxID=3234199 RepID=UPI00384C5635
MIATTSPAFEVSSKRRKGYPSETRVKRGLRFVHGDIELIEKLGRKDPCPCGSGKSFQAVLPALGPVSMGPSGMIIGATEDRGRSGGDRRTGCSIRARVR